MDKKKVIRFFVTPCIPGFVVASLIVAAMAAIAAILITATDPTYVERNVDMADLQRKSVVVTAVLGILLTPVFYSWIFGIFGG